MVKKDWGEGPAQEALLARLQSFMPVPPKGQTLVDYLGAGYPLFGNAGRRWSGIREMGFPFLVTRDRVFTECYVRAICPEGRETVAVEALTSGAWKIPSDLHVRVWTPQPKKKDESPENVLPETMKAFQDANIHALEFMNTVKSAENSVRIPDMNIDVSQPFFEEWMSVMRSGDPYLCFLPERKPSRTVEGLRWFQSVVGISFNGDNRKITEDALNLRMNADTQGGNSVAPEVVWLWNVREWALANVFARQSGVTETVAWSGLKISLGYRLKDAVAQMRKVDKEQSSIFSTMGAYLMDCVRADEAQTVLDEMDTLWENERLSEWLNQMCGLDERVREQGFDVAF